MAAQAFVQNGARVFIASRKEGELRKVCSKGRLKNLRELSCRLNIGESFEGLARRDLEDEGERKEGGRKLVRD